MSLSEDFFIYNYKCFWATTISFNTAVEEKTQFSIIKERWRSFQRKPSVTSTFYCPCSSHDHDENKVRGQHGQSRFKFSTTQTALELEYTFPVPTYNNKSLQCYYVSSVHAHNISVYYYVPSFKLEITKNTCFLICLHGIFLQGCCKSSRFNLWVLVWSLVFYYVYNAKIIHILTFKAVSGSLSIYGAIISSETVFHLLIYSIVFYSYTLFLNNESPIEIKTLFFKVWNGIGFVPGLNCCFLPPCVCQIHYVILSL